MNLKELRQSIIKNIKEEQEAFKRMSPEEKRVVIAKDTINQLKARIILAKRGTYFESEIEGDGDDQVRDLLLDSIAKEVDPCEVCAKGAIFTSLVLRQNDLTLKELFNDFPDGYSDEDRDPNKLDVLEDEHVSGYSTSLFDPRQLDLIERVFESSESFDFPEYNGYESTSEETLIQIMENIIANNGTFKPKMMCNWGGCSSEGVVLMGIAAYCDLHVDSAHRYWPELKRYEQIPLGSEKTE